MRMMFPGVRERRAVDRLLTSFFREHREFDFLRALGMLARFYHLRRPRVRWFEYLDWGKTAGRTYENGNIQMVHPESWKRGRKYNSERQWIHTFYHEFGHYVLWADPERKADGFAYTFVRGVSPERRGRSRTRLVGSTASRARRKRARLRRSRLPRRPRRSRSR